MQPSPDITSSARRPSVRKSVDRADFQSALLELTKSDMHDFEEALREILRKDAEVLNVERVSAWFFDAEYTRMTCRELFQLGKGFQPNAAVLEARDYPRYFAAMLQQRVIAASDARKDPKTSEFTNGYLDPLGITAMLDVPIWQRGRMVGVVCHEHVGGMRLWSTREQNFAGSVSDMISRAMEVAERANAERLNAAIIEAALDCIMVMDGEGRICEFNPAAERTFGFKRDDVLGCSLADTLIPPRFRDAHNRGFQRFLATGVPRVMGSRLELSAMRADGTEFPCELTISLTKMHGRSLFAAYLRDISARVQAERRQAAQLAATRVLAEAATLAEAAPRILQSVCEGLDWDVGAIWCVEGKVLGCVEVWHGDESSFGEFVATTRRQKFAAGVGLPGRIWKSGEPVWLANLSKELHLPRAGTVTAALLKSAFGFPIRLGANVLGVVEFFSRELREVDAELLAIFDAIGAQIGLFIERRRAEEELRALNAELETRVAARTRELAEANARIQEALEREQELGMLKSNFITTVTHEFRTPLGVILSSAEMLQHYFERLEAAERNEQLETISDAVQRMAALMEEVLLFHKVEGGVSELTAEDHDLAGLCRQIANEVASATAHRCEIQCKLPKLPKGHLDQRLFRHILVNLLNNAVKYSELGCRVDLVLKRDGPEAVLTVRDEGIGIAPDDLKGLFVPFRRGGNVGQRAGTGLGLSIAKRCVDLHGGSLELRSELGKGTTATLRLPVFNKV